MTSVVCKEIVVDSPYNKLMAMHYPLYCCNSKVSFSYFGDDTQRSLQQHPQAGRKGEHDAAWLQQCSTRIEAKQKRKYTLFARRRILWLGFEVLTAVVRVLSSGI
jgi:spore coat protein CotH